MGALAARCPGPAVPVVLSLARRSFTRRSARRRTASAGWPEPGSCPWRSCSAPLSCCGVLPPGCSGGGPRSSPPRCSPCSAPPCTWGLRHLRRDVGVPGRAGGLVRDPRRGRGNRRPGGWPRPAAASGAGQRHGVYLPAVRPAHRRARAAHRALGRPRLARGPACRDCPGRHGRAAGRRAGSRRGQLPGWFPADDADPGPWLGLPAVGARPVLVLGACCWSWPLSGVVISWASRHGAAQTCAARVLVRRPGDSGRWSRLTCTPWPR